MEVLGVIKLKMPYVWTEFEDMVQYFVLNGFIIAYGDSLLPQPWMGQEKNDSICGSIDFSITRLLNNSKKCIIW